MSVCTGVPGFGGGGLVGVRGALVRVGGGTCGAVDSGARGVDDLREGGGGGREPRGLGPAEERGGGGARPAGGDRTVVPEPRLGGGGLLPVGRPAEPELSLRGGGGRLVKGGDGTAPSIAVPEALLGGGRAVAGGRELGAGGGGAFLGGAWRSAELLGSMVLLLRIQN